MQNHKTSRRGQFKGDNDVRWTVRIVRKGGKYGLNDCLTHDETDPLVEFYDATSTVGTDGPGQYVSRYYAGTLFSDDYAPVFGSGECGLDLCGYAPDWSIDADTCTRIANWIKKHI